MEKIRNNFVVHFCNREFLISLGISLVSLGVSLVVNFYAGRYATSHASNAVTDIILNNIRTYDVGNVFIYSTLVFWGIVIAVLLFTIRKVPYVLKSISLFVLIRSVFISLTHIGPFGTQIVITSTTIVNKFSFGADLFFSGHTGLPFLLALIYWEKKPLRFFFIASSLFFAVVVLLGHLHYSIDVLAAFFITYTVFSLSEKLFKKDKSSI